MVDTTQNLESDFCLCGRYAWRVHCPHCGSYHNYSYKRADVVRRGNTLVNLTVYRCRRCNATFNDDDWKLRCQAPNIALTSGAGRRAGAGIGTGTSVDVAPTKFESIEDAPDVMRRALEEIKRKRGIE